MLLSDVACDHILEVHIQQHDAETRTLGHNNAEVVLRFCLPKLIAVCCTCTHDGRHSDMSKHSCLCMDLSAAADAMVVVATAAGGGGRCISIVGIV